MRCSIGDASLDARTKPDPSDGTVTYIGYGGTRWAGVSDWQT